MKRWLKVALGLASVVLVSALGAWALRAYVLHRLKAEAAQRGVELEPGVLTLSPGHIELGQARFRMRDVATFSGVIERVRVDLDWFTPSAVTVLGATVHGEMSRADVRAWVATPPSGGREPPSELLFRGEQIRLVMREPLSDDPWLTASNVELTRQETVTSFRAGEASILGRALGRLEGRLEPSRLEVRQIPEGETSGFKLSSDWDADQVAVYIDLGRAAVPVLPGSPEKVAALYVSGFVHARSRRAPPSRWEGDVELKLEGLSVLGAPPLGMSTFGNHAVFRFAFVTNEDQNALDLTTARLTLGALELAGKGRLNQLGADPLLALNLKGALSCRELSAMLIRSELGNIMSQWVGKPASQWVEGSVQVHLEVGSRLSELWVRPPMPQIGMGCGLAVPRELLSREKGNLAVPNLKMPSKKDLEWLQKIPDLFPMPQK